MDEVLAKLAALSTVITKSHITELDYIAVMSATTYAMVDATNLDIQPTLTRASESKAKARTEAISSFCDCLNFDGFYLIHK